MSFGVLEALGSVDAALAELVAPASKAVGLSSATTRFLLALALALPFALLHRLVRAPFLRLWSSTLVGLALLLLAFGPIGVFHQFITSFVVYLLMRSLARPLAAKLSFYWCLIYLSALHIHRQYFYYLAGDADWTAAQMMLTVKLTSLAYSHADALAEPSELLPEWKPLVVNSLPSASLFFGFVFHFGSTLAGPAWGYNEFERFIDLTAYPNMQIPFSVTQIGKRILQLVTVGVMHFVLVDYFPMKYVTTPEFGNSSVAYWYFFGAFASLGIRCQYYLIFTLLEIAADLSGSSWNGYWSDGSDRWDRLNMMNILAVEFSLSPRDTISNWNIQATRWFRLFIYFRLAPPGTKSSALAQVLTNLFSAFWHGFYPGYYIYFGLAAISLVFVKFARERIRPRVLALQSPVAKGLYDVAGLFITHLLIAFASPAWGMLSWSSWHTYAMHVHYNGLFIMLAGLAFVIFIVPTLPRPDPKDPKSINTKDKKDKAD